MKTKKPIDLYIKQNGQIIKYIAKLDTTLEKINDQNVLHCQALQSNSDILNELKNAIKYSLTMWKWIVVALVIAIIFLAGAEKALKFIPTL